MTIFNNEFEVEPSVVREKGKAVGFWRTLLSWVWWLGEFWGVSSQPGCEVAEDGQHRIYKIPSEVAGEAGADMSCCCYGHLDFYACGHCGIGQSYYTTDY